VHGRRPVRPIGHRCGAARPSESVEPNSSRLARARSRRFRVCLPACSADRRNVHTTAVTRRALHEWSRPPNNPRRIGGRTCSPRRSRTLRRARARLRRPAPGGGVSWKADRQCTAPTSACNNHYKIRRGGGEAGGAGCRIVGEERVHFGDRLHPPCSRGQPWVRRFYSIEDAGFATASGKPAIFVRRSSFSDSSPRVRSAARPT